MSIVDFFRRKPASFSEILKLAKGAGSPTTVELRVELSSKTEKGMLGSTTVVLCEVVFLIRLPRGRMIVRRERVPEQRGGLAVQDHRARRKLQGLLLASKRVDEFRAAKIPARLFDRDGLEVDDKGRAGLRENAAVLGIVG
ncbi:MAG: hypothetical protein V2A55_03615 [Candidatus Jorgensenbacteria bacterium]